MQLKIEQAVSKFPQVAYVFSKTGTAEVASDPTPVDPAQPVGEVIDGEVVTG